MQCSANEMLFSDSIHASQRWWVSDAPVLRHDTLAAIAAAAWLIVVVAKVGVTRGRSRGVARGQGGAVAGRGVATAAAAGCSVRVPARGGRSILLEAGQVLVLRLRDDTRQDVHIIIPLREPKHLRWQFIHDRRRLREAGTRLHCATDGAL
jgi:hypothetical protein